VAPHFSAHGSGRNIAAGSSSGSKSGSNFHYYGCNKESNNPEKSSRLFSEEWTKAWQQLEERVRQRPGPDLLMTFAIGYFLQMLPIENLLLLTVKLARPILFLVCAFQLAKYFPKGSNPGAVPTVEL
jgi:hypothetical protein